MVCFYVVQSIVSIALVISYFLLVRYTFFLKKATEKYAETTEGLLKQSKEAFEQSKRALEIDVFNKIVSSTLQFDAQLSISRDPHKNTYVSGFAAGMLMTLEDIDLSMFKAVSKAIEAWYEINKGDPARIFHNTLDKIKGKQVSNEPK